MSDFRLALAMEVAEQIGAELFPGRCDRCRSPLLEKPEQEMPFCWFCVTDKMTAQRGRTALTKARMAAGGIFIADMHEHPLAAKRRELEMAWDGGRS